MGEKGQIVALEVNMRPCGGFTPDMINFARSTNVYKIWADMIAFGGTDMPVGEHYYCPFAGRRDGKNFVYSHEQIMQKYQKNIKMVDRIPDALSGAMGNQMYVATFSTREEMEQFYSDVLAVTDGDAAAAQAALSQVLALGEPTPEAQPQPGGQAHHSRDQDPHPRRHQDRPQGPEVISTKTLQTAAAERNKRLCGCFLA
jgi:hypothetical protein